MTFICVLNFRYFIKHIYLKYSLFKNLMKNILLLGFPVGSDDKESACNAEDPCLTLGEGSGIPLQYYCLGSLIESPS